VTFAFRLGLGAGCGSAVVAQPRCGAYEIEVYFEGAAPGRRGLRTFCRSGAIGKRPTA
jgi:hypothetical protein